MPQLNATGPSSAGKTCVIFGGKGYIGSFFASDLLEAGVFDRIFLADISEAKKGVWPATVGRALYQERVVLLNIDVRHKINADLLPRDCDLICNFAAIHREPGHLRDEYFETNILGAENICNWAEAVGCNNVLFTSSIAVYGPVSAPVDEAALPMPETPYGISKLVAEQLHLAWQQRDSRNRRLIIARPGVVFGPGEDGNVTRLVKSILGRYFLFPGNKKTIKSGIYIKELCHAMHWSLADRHGDNRALINLSMNPPPTIEDYVSVICKVASVRRFIPSLPYALVYIPTVIVEIIAKLLRLRQPISPMRIRKLAQTNHIIPAYLIRHGYSYRYTLESALNDWKKTRPSDWE